MSDFQINLCTSRSDLKAMALTPQHPQRARARKERRVWKGVRHHVLHTHSRGLNDPLSPIPLPGSLARFSTPFPCSHPQLPFKRFPDADATPPVRGRGGPAAEDQGWGALAGRKGGELGGSAGQLRNGLDHLVDDTLFRDTKHLGMRQSPLLGVTDLWLFGVGLLLYLDLFQLEIQVAHGTCLVRT